MKKFINYVLILPLLLGGCSKSRDNENFAPDTKVEVCIKSSSDLTRTAISDDLSTTWVVGDKIALWARSTESVSDWAIEAEPFTLKYYGSNYSEAKFSAAINPMEEGMYTYYSVYPTPNSTNGTEATFNISGAQNGKYMGDSDIMVATPMESSELTTSTLGMPSLNFMHKMHMIRVEIPDGCNNFGKPISKLEVTFPTNVVGDVTIDAADPTSPTTLSNGTRKVTVNLDEPFVTGTGNYIWLFVAPTTISGELEIIGYNDDGSCSAPVTKQVDNVLREGKITKLNLTLPAAEITTLNVTIPSADMTSKIGEALSKVTFTLTNGVKFTNGTSTLVMDAHSGSDVYAIDFYNASKFTTSLTSASLGVELETNSVVKTPASISLASITLKQANALKVSVPNFFYTNFSEITSEAYGPETTGAFGDAADVAIAGMDGWMGSQRSIWYKNSHIAIRPYTFMKKDYESRINSCSLSKWGLQDNKEVTITVKYTANWAKKHFDGMKIITGTSTKTYLGVGFNKSTTKEIASGKNTTIEVDIPNVYNNHHISWESDGYDDSFNTSIKSYDVITIDELYVTIKSN